MTEHLTALFEGLTPLWEMSFTAAWVAGIVCLLRLLLKNRAPKRVLCLLWLVVFARLLVPVKLESPVSLVPPALSQADRVWTPAPPQDGAALRPADPAQSSAPGQSGVPGQPPAPGQSADPSGLYPVVTVPGLTDNTSASGSTGFTGSTGSSQDSQDSQGSQGAQDTGAHAFPWKALLANLWLTGAAGMLGYGLVTYVRIHRRVRFAVRVADRVWEDENVSSPFILGLFRPRVYLPIGLEGQARQYILCHEFAHLRRLDHIVKPLCWFALAIHWFNPAVWAAFLLLGRDMEGACDEAVLRSLGEEVKAGYSYTLLALASGGRVPAPCPLAFDEGDAKGRIKNVLNYRRPALWIVVMSILAVVVAAVCLLTNPVAAEEPADSPDPSESEPGPSQSPGASQDPGASPSQAPDESLNSVLDPWMLEVLNNERTFCVYYSYDGHETQWNISQLADVLYNGYSPVPSIAVERLAILDLDGDGARELVIDPGDAYKYTTGYLILRQEGDTIQGYNPYWRSFGTLKANGMFSWSGSAFYHGTGRARFEGGEFSVEQDTWVDFMEGKQDYFVEGQPAEEKYYVAHMAWYDSLPEPFWYTFEAGELCAHITIPVDNDVPVPDFLTADQQLLYRQATTLYTALFGPNTESIDTWPGPWPASEDSPWSNQVLIDGYGYIPATGLFANWDDLETAVLSVFTREFWDRHNIHQNNGSPYSIYTNVDGRTYYIAMARGNYGSNPNFPDTYHLPQITDTEISFVLVGYYSEPWPLEGESFEERDARLQTNWEEYIGYPMKLVLTENGWRFDEFHCTWIDNDAYAGQAAPNPALYPDNPEPAGGACVHGLDHVYVDHLIDGRLVYRCMEDFFPYYPPYPCAYSSEARWEGDCDGDGHIEEIAMNSAEVIMLCDVVDRELKTCTLDPHALWEGYPDADPSSAWFEPGDELIYCMSLRDKNGELAGTVRCRLYYDGTALTRGGPEVVPTQG